MRLIDADAFEIELQHEWGNNNISNGEWMDIRQWLKEAPTIDAESKTLLEAISLIKHFCENECDALYTSAIRVKKDGTMLRTDWGYFWEGLEEIEKWVKMDQEESDEADISGND